MNEAKERAETAESQVNKLKMKAKEFGKKVRQVFSSAVTFKALVFQAHVITWKIVSSEAFKNNIEKEFLIKSHVYSTCLGSTRQ